MRRASPAIDSLSRLGLPPREIGIVLADARLFVVLTQAEARGLVAGAKGMTDADACRGLAKIRTALYNIVSTGAQA
jgi:alanine-alpha-ketoisovalerate/valine-pyruvate aminotransferase